MLPLQNNPRRRKPAPLMLLDERQDEGRKESPATATFILRTPSPTLPIFPPTPSLQRPSSSTISITRSSNLAFRSSTAAPPSPLSPKRTTLIPLPRSTTTSSNRENIGAEPASPRRRATTVTANPATVTVTLASPRITSSSSFASGSSTQLSASLNPALEVTATPTPAPGSGATVPQAAVVALGLLGATAGISVIATLALVLWRRRKQKKATTEPDPIGDNQETRQIPGPGFSVFEDTQPILRTTPS
ncbi:hypothetical protein MRS44_013375 [Fusarium solani]|uniref:uncharacterized protein n=1 Tax=Fusarium solani TaxID=169388 RepID=UPI0032C45F03|nr:hypothetical protein MRS44_013375 [Fusarium solani]